MCAQSLFREHRAERDGSLPPEPAGEPSDAAFVEQIRSGSGRALELLMRRYNQRLYRVAHGILNDSDEAEDVVQETYVRAYARLDQFRGPDRFGAWLTRIAANEALSRLRRRRPVQALEAGRGGGGEEDDDHFMTTLKSDLPDPERGAAATELRPLLENAIDRLPADFRSVFILRAVEQMSIAETADVLGIRPETVKTRFHRARKLLQDALGQQLAAAELTLFPFAGARCDRAVATVLARLGLGAPGAGRRPDPPQPLPNPFNEGDPHD